MLAGNSIEASMPMWRSGKPSSISAASRPLTRANPRADQGPRRKHKAEYQWIPDAELVPGSMDCLEHGPCPILMLQQHYNSPAQAPVQIT